jgi:hypothetical protein
MPAIKPYPMQMVRVRSSKTTTKVDGRLLVLEGANEW